MAITERAEAYALFNELTRTVSQEIVSFTAANKLDLGKKEDRTLVTACDKHLDTVAGRIAQSRGLLVISEERENDLEILRKGNYITIDSIDGTIGYTQHVSTTTGPNPCINPDFGSEADYSFLSAIVIDGVPRFGCCYNYVTGEKILLDSTGGEHTIREGKNLRSYSARNAHYFENRTLEEIQQGKDPISKRLYEDPDSTKFNVHDIGFRAVVLQLNDHESAATVHLAQQHGLWDVAPALVAAQFTGAKVLDDRGRPITCTEYLLVPGRGAAILKGDHFGWVEKELQKQ